MDPLVTQLRDLLEQTEPFQRKMKAGHSRKKKRVIGHGRQNAGPPYTIKPSMERSKSAPPIGENVIYTSLDEGLLDAIRSLFQNKKTMSRLDPTFSSERIFDTHNTYKDMPSESFNQLDGDIYVGRQPVDTVKNLQDNVKHFDKIYMVASEVDYEPKPEEKDKVVVVPVGRDVENPDEQTLDKMEQVAQQVSKESGKVLVTCKAGLNRSAAIAARAVILKDPSKKNEIINLVRSARGSRSLNLDLFTHGKEGEHTAFINFILNGPPNNQEISEHIVKQGSKYCLKSKKSNKNLGCYTSKKGAKNREKQVQYFKHIKENLLEQVVKEVIKDIIR